MSVVLFAASAIATTAIAGLLTASQFVSDFLCTAYGYCTIGQRRVIRILSVAFPALLSFSSPDYFYAAMAFAGAIPVCLLWGLLPSFLLDALRQRNDLVDTTSKDLTILPGGTPVLRGLQLTSIALLAVNLYTYLSPLLTRLATFVFVSG